MSEKRNHPFCQKTAYFGSKSRIFSITKLYQTLKFFKKWISLKFKVKTGSKKNEIIFTSVFQNLVFFGFKSEKIYCRIFRKNFETILFHVLSCVSDVRFSHFELAAAVPEADFSILNFRYWFLFFFRVFDRKIF